MERLEGRPCGLGRKQFRPKKKEFARWVVSLTLLCLASGPARALEPNQPPGSNFDLSHWYLGIPTAPNSIPAAQLTAGYTSAFFFTGSDGAMVFWCPVSGGTTANSSYPRSELREQISPPNNSVNWPAQGTHILEAQCRVTVLPSTRKIIIGQIHSYLGAARPLLKLVFNNGMIDAQVKESPNADDDMHVSFPNVPFNTPITYRILFADGLLSMTVNGVTRTVDVYDNDPDWEDQTFYFKAGAYVQDNEGPSSEGGRVEFYQLSASHFDSAAVPPSITSQPASQSVDSGTTVAFNVTATGSPPLIYQWHRDGVPLLDGDGVRGTTTASLVLSNVQPAQAGSYSVVVSNAADSVTSSDALLVVTPVLALAEALEAASLAWTTNPAPGPYWIGQSLDTHDGQDAARSGAIGHSRTTAFQTTVSGPGSVSFWWKASSETNRDYLIFHVGSSEQARISGEVNWQQRTFNVPSGSQTLKWTYSKNSSGTGGQDRVWVDEVRFGPQPPAITRQPTNQTVDAGTTVTFSVAATGAPPLSYQWRLDGNDLVNDGAVRGATTATLTLSNVPLALAGNYSVVVRNVADSVTSADALLTVNPVLLLAEALDTPSLVWTTIGSPPWIGQPNVTQDGEDAARSGIIGHNATTTIQTIVQGPGTVSFWWKVSCQSSSDRLLFYVNGSERTRITGEVDWQWRTFSISSGTQTLRWTYSKNSSGIGGLDRAWVDQVRFGAVPPSITTQPANLTVDAGTTASFNVVAAGTAPLSYRWRFNGEPLSDGSGISGAATATLNIANVQSPRVGTYSVVASNSANSVTSAEASLALSLNLSLAEALDSTGLTYTTGGTGQPWRGQPAVSHDGSDAAQTGTVGNSTYTWIKTPVTGPATLTFWWKVSSEPGRDYLRFMMDAADQVRISGEVDWQQVTFNVPSGNHELQWRYSKNPSSAAGQDRGWLDQVELAPAVAKALVSSATPSTSIVTTVTRTGDEALLTWNAEPGQVYRVFYTDSLADTDWIMMAGGVEAIGSWASVADNGAVPHRFYRVVEE